MAGYIRQSSFSDGDTITAALFNNEYNQLLNAFSNTSGHAHDGTSAEGPVIGLIGDAGETAPNNKVLIDTTNNYIEFYVQVSSSPVQQLYIADGAIVPVTDSDIDLGTTSLRFKDTYTDTVTTTGNVSVGGNLTVTGTTTFNGGTITMGDAATDNVVFGADVDSNIIPDDDDTYDLGSSSQQWRNLYIDGTAEIDTLAINGTTVTSTAAELNILDGVTASATDINLIDGITNGTVIASKAIVTDSNKDITGGRNITISGELDAATLDISGDADIDGTLEADAITIAGVTLAETISDTVGAMVSSNTETNITVTYDDSDNTLDFVLPASLEITTAVGIGGGSTNGVQISQGAIAIKNGGAQSYVDFYCESSNAHYTRLQAAAHSAYSGNVTATLPVTTGTLAITSEIPTTEQIQDIVGAMVSSNTETNITITYQDSDGTLDFVVDAAQPNVTSLGTLTSLTVDDITIDSSTISDSGDLTIDVGGDIILDADGADFRYKDAGTEFLRINNGASGPVLLSSVSDKDLIFKGNDGGSEITALTLDMSDAGTAIFNHDITLPDNGKAIFGASQDLQIYHDGSNSYIKDAGTGSLLIDATNLYLRNASGEEYASFIADGAANLKYNGSTKIVTTSTGIDVTGEVAATSLDISGDVDVDGTLETDALTIGGVTLAETISDTVGAMVTSNTESGITVAYQDADNTLDFTIGTLNQDTTGTAATVTGAAQSNITSLGTLTTLTVDDITINGSTISDGGALDITSGADFTVDSAADINLDAGGGDWRLKDDGTTICTISNVSGDLQLLLGTQDKDFKFQGNDGGAQITALTLDMSDAGTAIFNHDVQVPDNGKFTAGAGSDLKIYHSSSDNNSYIEESGSGSLVIKADDLYIQNAAGSENMALFAEDGAVTLYHNSSSKIATTVAGVSVTGKAVGTLTTDNDGSFDMNASNNFKCTPSGNFTLTFTNISAQSGNILLINSGGHTVSAHANTKVDANILGTISTAGTYLLAYFSDGTNVYMTNSAAYS